MKEGEILMGLRAKRSPAKEGSYSRTYSCKLWLQVFELDSTAAPSYVPVCMMFLILNMINCKKKHGNTLPSEPIHAISIFIHVDTQCLSLSLSEYKYIYVLCNYEKKYIYTYTVHTCHPNTSHHQRSLEALDAWGPSFWHPS